MKRAFAALLVLAGALLILALRFGRREPVAAAALEVVGDGAVGSADAVASRELRAPSAAQRPPQWRGGALARFMQHTAPLAERLDVRARDLDTALLAELRSQVATSGLNAAELRAAAERRAPGDPQRLCLTLATVWTGPLGADHERWLLRLAETWDAGAAPEADAFAATHALRLAGHGELLERVALGLLRNAGPAWSAEFAGESAARLELALSGIERVSAVDWHVAFREWLAPTAGSAPGLWPLAVRSDPDTWWARGVTAARERRPGAARALESGDARAVAELVDAANGAEGSSALRDDALTSALRALVGAADRASLECVRGELESAAGERRACAIEALETFDLQRDDPAEPLAGLLAFLEALDDDLPARTALEGRLVVHWRRQRLTLEGPEERASFRAALSAAAGALRTGSRQRLLAEQMLRDLEP